MQKKTSPGDKARLSLAGQSQQHLFWLLARGPGARLGLGTPGKLFLRGPGTKPGQSLVMFTMCQPTPSLRGERKPQGREQVGLWWL